MSLRIDTSDAGRLTDLVSLGALTSLIPREVLDGAIEAHGRREERVRKLPSHLVVYLLVALCLFPDDDYEQVAEKLAGLLSGVPGAHWPPPSRGAITQARKRLGPEVVRELFGRLARPAATSATAGAWLERWRLMALDGFVLDLPDTDANVAEFGKEQVGGDGAAFPQARVVAISECASHAVVAADLAGRGTGEQALARSLYRQLGADMLLTADRRFYSFDAWRQARRSGAQLLWRVQAGLQPTHLRDLPDGSWLGVVAGPDLGQPSRDRLAAAARAGRPLDEDRAVVVRVVEYRVPDRRGADLRLLTSILDPSAAGAEKLAQAYHGRWEAEAGADRLRTQLRGPGRILRSRTPDLAHQEIWAYLLTHWAVATLVCTTATAVGLDPDRAKACADLRIVRRPVADRPTSQPSRS